MAPLTGQLAAVPAVEVEFRLPGIAFVTLRGEHDLSSKPDLTEALTAASAKRDVLVDLSDCTFMDSSVIGALFRAHQSLAEGGGRLELVIPESATTVKRVADATLLAACCLSTKRVAPPSHASAQASTPSGSGISG
jgi:anti-anti-sigma factor